MPRQTSRHNLSILWLCVLLPHKALPLVNPRKTFINRQNALFSPPLSQRTLEGKPYWPMASANCGKLKLLEEAFKNTTSLLYPSIPPGMTILHLKIKKRYVRYTKNWSNNATFILVVISKDLKPSMQKVKEINATGCISIWQITSWVPSIILCLLHFNETQVKE